MDKKITFLISLKLVCLVNFSCAGSTLPPYRFQLPNNTVHGIAAYRNDRKSVSRTQFPYPFVATGNRTADALFEGGDLHQRFLYEINLLNGAKHPNTAPRGHQHGGRVNLTINHNKIKKATFMPPIYRNIPEHVFGEREPDAAGYPVTDKTDAKVSADSLPVSSVNTPNFKPPITRAVSSQLSEITHNGIGHLSENKHQKATDEKVKDNAKAQPDETSKPYPQSTDKTAQAGNSSKEHSESTVIGEGVGGRGPENRTAEDAPDFLEILKSVEKLVLAEGRLKTLRAVNGGNVSDDLSKSPVYGNSSDFLTNSSSCGNRTGRSNTAKYVESVDVADLLGNLSAALFLCLTNQNQSYFSILGCAQLGLTRTLDEVLLAGRINVVPGVSLTRQDGSLRDKSLEEDELELRDIVPLNDWFTVVIDKIGRFFRTYSLDLSLDGLNSVLEGRGHHHYRRVFPIIVTTYMIMSTFLVPIGFLFMSMLGGKALVLSKLAFLWSIMGVSRRILPLPYPEPYAAPLDHPQHAYYRAAHRKDNLL